MKLIRFSVFATFACLASVLLGGCSDDDGIDNRDLDYGYVQFKLYKADSYQSPQAAQAASGSRAIKPELDYLSEASKVKVTLSFGEATIAQTLILSATDKESAEYGLRSEKLKLLTGEYQVVTFALYDANDEPIYNGTPLQSSITIVAGGLATHDLTVDVVPRGKVRFTLKKDLSDFVDTPKPETRAVNRQYTFDEIAAISITVQDKKTSEQTKFEKLPAKFSIHFIEDKEKNEEHPFGYQTSSIACDTLLSLPASDYRILTYETYDKNKILLETNIRPKNSDFTVEDNTITEVEAKITLYEADEYIKDCYALYEIWKALDGPNWYYKGENYADGTNWDFNKDPDMWYAQPGVEVHSNGRVAKISIGEFGYRGHMPAALGQLTELIELYLGSHNDKNGGVYDPSLATDQSLSERSRNRMQNHKKYLAMINPATQMSWPCAFALKEHGLSAPGTSLYEQGYTKEDIFDPVTGKQRIIRPYDMIHGKLTNGLLSLPKEIGNLKKLEYLFIANSEITELPDELSELVSVTDAEFYNCPKMIRFPLAIAKMPKLISLNISNNAQWSAEEVYKGMEALSTGASKEEIQILYCRDNKLEELPRSFENMKKLSLLDLSNNRISKIHPLGKEVAIVQLFLDNNLLEEIPLNEDGIFCTLDDAENISVKNNRLKEFPNMFTSKSKFTIENVDFSGNQITGFPADFKGLNIKQFTLSNNPITKFPKCLGETNSYVSYILLTNCKLEEIPEGSFKGKYSSGLISLDLRFNKLKKFPKDFTAEDLPYLYGIDVSFNAFDKFPLEPFNASGLTVFAIEGQRNERGERCLKEWPKGVYNHTGMRMLNLASNDLRKVDDVLLPSIPYLYINDNPNITVDASTVCYYWQNNAYIFIYDKTQNILNCDAMLE